MKAIDIKEKRKKLGITQKELAELVGVSTQTINGYENGKEIPTTKHQILDSVLNQKFDVLVLNEETTKYETISGFDKNIIETINEIAKKQSELNSLKENTKNYNMTIEIIELLKEKLEIYKIAKKNH